MFHETNRTRRGHDLFSVFREGLYPALYEGENTKPSEKLVVEHFFIDACHWWMTEFDPEQLLGFGFATLGDEYSAEWGYFSLVELEGISIDSPIVINGQHSTVPNFVERELDWLPRPAAEVIPSNFHRDFWFPETKTANAE